jgi:hypoxanthine phosphoribosyltransferase
MRNNIKEVLIPKSEIEAKLEELGARITEEYQGKELLMVCILRGASIFFADLVRKINLPLKIDFMSISSYGSGARSSGEVKINKDLDKSIEGKHVIVVEDIVDSGNTLSYLKEVLLARQPASLKICTLLDKPSRREVPLEADYVGFVVPNEFVIGYGLDYAELYRNLEEVCILDPKVYS